MALDAPLHKQCRVSPHQRHGIYSTMAGDASDAFFNMDAVVEVHEIWQIMHTCPFNRFTGSKAAADRLELWAISPDLRMTLHTDLSGGDSREWADLDGYM